MGVDMIGVTGGMRRVDPDDRTASRKPAVNVTWRGLVLPGPAFMLSYIDDILVVGLPGCVMYSRTSVFRPDRSQAAGGEKWITEEILKAGSRGTLPQL